MGWQVLFHSGGMASVIRHVIADSGGNPGIGATCSSSMTPTEAACTSRT